MRDPRHCAKFLSTLKRYRQTPENPLLESRWGETIGSFQSAGLIGTQQRVQTTGTRCTQLWVTAPGLKASQPGARVTGSLISDSHILLPRVVR